MSETNVCHNRPSKQRVSMEVCRYHVEQEDKTCLRKSAGNIVCQIAGRLLKGGDYYSTPKARISS